VPQKGFPGVTLPTFQFQIPWGSCWRAQPKSKPSSCPVPLVYHVVGGEIPSLGAPSSEKTPRLTLAPRDPIPGLQNNFLLSAMDACPNALWLWAPPLVPYRPAPHSCAGHIPTCKCP
jgi:hypothetical protein